MTTQPITRQDLDQLEQYIWSHDHLTRREIDNTGYINEAVYRREHREADAELQTALSLLNRLRAQLNLE